MTIESELMRAEPGDIVVLRVAEDVNIEDAKNAANQLRAALLDGVVVVVVTDKFKIQHLPAAEMARLGWVRAH